MARMFVGTRKGLFIYEKNPAWKITNRQFVGDPVNLVSIDDRDGAVYAAEWMGGGQPYPAIHSICVDPRNGDDIIIGVSIGGG
jgi:hypothetical protein